MCITTLPMKWEHPYGIIHEFANGRLNPLLQVIYKDIKEDWAQPI